MHYSLIDDTLLCCLNLTKISACATRSTLFLNHYIHYHSPLCYEDLSFQFATLIATLDSIFLFFFILYTFV